MSWPMVSVSGKLGETKGARWATFAPFFIENEGNFDAAS